MTTTTIAESLLSAIGGEAALQVSAFDGSQAGPPDAQLRVRIANRTALARIVTAPGPLGLARAFVAGDLELDGELYAALRLLDGRRIAALDWRGRVELLRAVGLAALRPVPPPEQELRRRSRLGRRHGRRRDAAAIAHHYDVSNRFYELLLGPSMAYTCAVYERPDVSLEQAQWDKHDLVARKLALAPGQRLLDVGCGWGGMVRHAAREYGVRALGVTLSRQQAEWAQKAIAEEGLSELAEVRHCDYRDVTETGFDAVSSIGLTEHIGRAQLPNYVSHLAARLRPQGRLLNHCIMRPTTDAPPIVRRGFIDSYIFPDGELSGLGTVVAAIQDHGFEVRHEESLREHYALTLRDWCANLERNWDEVVAEVGPATARVWAVYLAGSRLGFETNAVQLHQVLAVRTVDGDSGFPLRPAY